MTTALHPGRMPTPWPTRRVAGGDQSLIETEGFATAATCTA
ncbi:hypothetical protein [Vineibacter terrae]|nr:hypothetical protein [Vineibacter terrae]HEX2886295.1 hypothetical protein [Vineibacter terrae]